MKFLHFSQFTIYINTQLVRRLAEIGRDYSTGSFKRQDLELCTSHKSKVIDRMKVRKHRAWFTKQREFFF